MPIYRFHTFSDSGVSKVEEIGFYQDAAAANHGRKLARGAPVEVWRGTELVASFGVPARAEPEPA